MGKASSSKKVARAARAGRTTSSTERRDWGFPLAVLLVVVLGVGLVIYSRASRDATAAPRVDPQDHWHSAYGIYDCRTDSWVPDLQGTDDPDGIHSHQDGLIHVHPFNSSASGADAQIHVFAEAMGIEINTEGITLDDGTGMEAGAECEGEEAIIQIHRWDADNLELEPDVFTEDLGDVRFRKDREAFVIALAPEGAELELPPSMPELDRASPTIIDPTQPEGGATPAGDAPTEGDAPTGSDVPAGSDAPTESDPPAEEAPSESAGSEGDEPVESSNDEG